MNEAIHHKAACVKPMNILYVAHRIPYPPDKGDKIRSFHQVQYLGKRHNVWCACFVDDPADRRHLATLRQWCREVEGVPLSRLSRTLHATLAMGLGGTITEGFYRSAQMGRLLKRWSHAIEFDAAVFFSSSVAQYKSAVTARRMVLDFCDWDSLKWESYASDSRGLKACLYGLEAGRLRRREKYWLKQFDACTVVTEAEAGAWTEATAAGRLYVVGNGRDVGPEPVVLSNNVPPRIGFVGEMSYRPNVDAVRWFAKEVLPRVRQEVSDATFEIVGRRPTREVVKLGRRDGINVTGAVDDVRSHVEQFAVSVAPMRMGRGLQNKVLEAMAASRPVVLSSAAAAGIDAVDQEHFVVADDARAVSDRIIRLLRNPSRRASLGTAARKHVARRYSWEREIGKLEALLRGDCPTQRSPMPSAEEEKKAGAL